MELVQQLMGTKKKTSKKAAGASAPLDSAPSADAAPSLSDILKGDKKKDDIPSDAKLKETIDKQRAEGPRAPLSRKEQKVENERADAERMEQMIAVLAGAGVQALNGGMTRLDETYKPIFDILEKQDGQRPSFELNKEEQGLLTLTTQMGMAQFSPEFLAKYGFAMLAVGTVASIGFPRFMLCLRLESVAKQLKAAQAKGQENAKRADVGSDSDNRVHGERKDGAGKVTDSQSVDTGTPDIYK